MNNIKTLLEGVADLGIELNKEQKDAFATYKEMLKEWNKKINITAIIDDHEIDIKHFLDSLTLARYFIGTKKVIDVGTGGGFPGLPLKIYNKELDMTLLDSLNKRIIFLDKVIEELKLDNVHPIHGRAEELGRNDEYRGKYDICVSRAVASLDTLSEYCLPFVKIGGHFISMKGTNFDEELKEAENGIKILGGKIVNKELVTIPGSEIKHALIIIEKIKGTPTKYPRVGGKPKNNPL